MWHLFEEAISFVQWLIAAIREHIDFIIFVGSTALMWHGGSVSPKQPTLSLLVSDELMLANVTTIYLNMKWQAVYLIFTTAACSPKLNPFIWEGRREKERLLFIK